MNINHLLITLFILSACILPFVYANSKKKKKKKIMLQSLQDFAAKSHCKIDECDIWYENIIGIDKDAHKLFFKSGNESNLIEKEINLSEIKKCRVINTGRAVSTPTGTQTVIEKLELAFSQNNQNDEIILGFYDSELYHLTLTDELQIIEKWAEIANQNIAVAKVKI